MKSAVPLLRRDRRVGSPSRRLVRDAHNHADSWLAKQVSASSAVIDLVADGLDRGGYIFSTKQDEKDKSQTTQSSCYWFQCYAV